MRGQRRGGEGGEQQKGKKCEKGDIKVERGTRRLKELKGRQAGRKL